MSGSSAVGMNYAQRARGLVDRWLDGPSGDVEIDDEGGELRDVFQTAVHVRSDLERRIADALRRAVRR